MFKTIKAAKEAGFRKPKDWEYGGARIKIKGRVLVHDPKQALSETQWSKRGYRTRRRVQPHAYRSVRISGAGRVVYEVYRDDQVEPKRRYSVVPPVEIDLLAAVWVINRRAKRCRDQARKCFESGRHEAATKLREEKEHLYELKGQALYHLVVERRLQFSGYHRFPDDNWAELLQGDGYSFHRPCSPPEGVDVIERSEIEAKPRGAREPRLKDALHTLQGYLDSKPKMALYKWPSKKTVIIGDDDDTDSFDDDDEFGWR
jgi:hypothetical protein